MRQWACDRETLYVVTSPIHEKRPTGDVRHAGNGDGKNGGGIEVDLPSHYCKLVFYPIRVEAIAFVLENRRLVTDDLWRYLTSIDEIEARGRLDFLSNLWEVAESAVENHTQPYLWREPSRECSRID